LGTAANRLSDQELERLLEQLYAMAQLIVETLPDHRVSTDDLEERAAIREFDGGLSREKAEAATVIDIATGKARQ
jgi:hypothetical protein